MNYISLSIHLTTYDVTHLGYTVQAWSVTTVPSSLIVTVASSHFQPPKRTFLSSFTGSPFIQVTSPEAVISESESAVVPSFHLPPSHLNVTYSVVCHIAYHIILSVTVLFPIGVTLISPSCGSLFHLASFSVVQNNNFAPSSSYA